MNTPLMTVFFDGGCPLCSKEIAHYRRLDAAGHIAWLDVTDGGIDLAPYGIERQAAMQEFHVLDHEGTLHVGADGFLTLWDALAGYRWLSRLCRLLRLPVVLRFAYRHFAAWHFRRRCRDGVCAN